MTRRLVLGFLGMATLVLVLLTVPLGVSNQRSEREDLTRGIERDAVAAASQADSALDAGGAASTEARRQLVADLRARMESYAERTDARVLVTDARGASIVDAGEDAGEVGRDFATRPEIARALRGEVASGERTSATLGHPLVYVAVPVTNSGRVIGSVRVSYPRDEVDRRVTAYWTGLASIAALVLALTSVAALLVARWIARPLERIAGVAVGMGEGDLDARADEGAGPPEVRVVAARLNQSIEAVRGLLEEQRSFTADVSHQLRTPLQAMMLRLDNVAHAIGSGDPAAAVEDTERAIAEVDRLASMVETLLVLERAGRDGGAEPERLDVSDVLRARREAWTELGRHRGVVVAVELQDVPEVLARAVHVEQVLDNYVDNAVNVLSQGGSIVVRTRVDASTGTLEVHVVDDGPGLADDQLEGVFRRFASGAARPRGDRGGFGLGLAIVRRLAEVDGGRAWLRHGPGRGIDAVVAYPLAASTD